MATLISSLNGTFSLAELSRLKWPVAWNVTVPKSEQESQESELRSLANEAISQLEEAYIYCELEEGQELEIKIVNGEITEIVTV